MPVTLKNKKEIILAYKGAIDYTIKQRLISEAASNDMIKSKALLAKKIRYVMDECLTNIIHYYRQKDVSHDQCSVTLRTRHKALLFTFSNFMDKADWKRFSDYVQLINDTPKGEKNLVFKKALRREIDQAKPGAGLGLVSLKKKYDCDINASYSRSLLRLVITLPA